MKPKRLISLRVLRTELSVAMQYIDSMDFGYAKRIIADVLARVEQYDLKNERRTDARTNTAK